MRKLFYRGSSRGHVLLGVIFVLSLSLITASGLLRLTTSSVRASHASKVRSREYTNAEASIGETVSWMRANSQAFLNAFRRDEFYTHFSRTDPSVGDNDTSIFQVPTRLKLSGTNDSAFVVTDTSLGTPAFAPLFDITTLANFPVASAFQTADVGPSQVRITLVDAIPEDPTGDFGPPPAAAPTTDFRPVYRIDSMTASDSGGHVYAIVKTDLLNLFDIGFYGQDYLEFRQPCDSYISDNGPYAGNQRPGCTVGSNSTSQIHKSEAIYGSLRTNGTVNEEAPFGGDVCADFSGGCPNEGEKCSGEDCSVPLLEQFQSWDVYCPTDQGNVTFTTNTTLVLSGNTPSQTCWNRVTINNNVTLTLQTTGTPYFFRTLELRNSSNSRLDIAPVPNTAQVELYTEKIVGDTLNGNMAFNSTQKPGLFALYYLGMDPLTFNGNANFYGTIVAPRARVDIMGSFEYYGALLAKELALNGSGSVHYDESLSGNGKVSDVQFEIVEMGQRYR